MGWFDEQIEYRKKHERELLADSFDNIGRSITGRRTRTHFAEEADVSDAVSALLGYLGIRKRKSRRRSRVWRTGWISCSHPPACSTVRWF